MPGKTYQTVNDLHKDTQHTHWIRMYGKKMIAKPSQTIPDYQYPEMQDATSDESIETLIYAVKFSGRRAYRFNMNAYANGADAAYTFAITNDNIASMQLEPIQK